MAFVSAEVEGRMSYESVAERITRGVVFQIEASVITPMGNISEKSMDAEFSADVPAWPTKPAHVSAFGHCEELLYYTQPEIGMKAS
jgi:hypothetical protein